MKRFISGLIVVSALLAQKNGNPFLGRWNFNVTTSTGPRANWLGVSEKDGKLEVWFQPTGGNLYEVKDFKVDGAHLTLHVSQAMTWELDAKDGKLAGVQKRGDNTMQLTGVRAPVLNRSVPEAWTNPEPLFNGKNLDGWTPIGNPANSHWTVKDGLLVNQDHGANLKTTRTFDDFKVHYEVNCPDDGNSGFYLRGRYEVQIEYEPLTSNPVERRIGSIYGRIAPKPELPRTPGQWETFDVTLVGRTVTVVRNGITSIDGREIEGITGGALDANEGEPGPFYIQGDHTGGLKFRNITVSIPKRGAATDSPAGVWRGDSLCTTDAPSCKNENVVYYIEAIAGKPDYMSIRADKIVDGKAITMGVGEWQYSRAKQTLSLQTDQRIWLLTINGKRIEATLTLPGNVVFRRMTLKKDE